MADAVNSNPERPSTQYLRSLVPNTSKSMVSGTINLKHWVLGPSGKAQLIATSTFISEPKALHPGAGT